MTTLPVALSRQNEIAQIVSEAEAELRPVVKRIRWEIGQDWTGDWAIFLRVVLSNNATRGKNLSKSMAKVESHMRAKLRPDDLGAFAYFNYRSQAEQIAMRDKAWM